MLFNRTKGYIGRQIGNYKIIKCIGQGRYGVCFLAESSNNRVVLKRLKKHIMSKHTDKASFEAKILYGLDHKGIPKLLDVINEKDFYGLVLEEKFGDTVEAVLFKKKHSFTTTEIYSIGKQLIEIIKYLHHNGIVHRDIRTPNVIINEKQVSLVDFGLARWADDNLYTKDIDFSYLGDFLLYLYYSSYIKNDKKSSPWYEELVLSPDEKLFLKKLLKLEEPYSDIEEIEENFERIFSI